MFSSMFVLNFGSERHNVVDSILLCFNLPKKQLGAVVALCWICHMLFGKIFQLNSPGQDF